MHDVTDNIEKNIGYGRAAIEGEAPRTSADETHLSFGDTIHRFANAAKEAVDSHVSLARIRLLLVGSAAKWIAIFGIIAFITAFGMIVTLMVGAVLALAPLWGLGLALLIVTGLGLLGIALCALGIRAQIIRIKRAVE